MGDGALTVLKLRRDYLKQGALELRRIGTYLENVRSGLNGMLHGKIPDCQIIRGYLEAHFPSFPRLKFDPFETTQKSNRSRHA